MKICMLTSTHGPGDGRIFQKEAKSLAKEHDVTIIAPSNESGSSITEGIRIVTVKRPDSTALHPITLLRLLRACLAEDADVYHCHEPDALLIGVLAKYLKGKRVIYDIHEHWPSEIPFDLRIPNGSLIQRALSAFVSSVEIALARRAESTFAVSESVAARFRERGLEPVILSNYSIADLDIPYSPNRNGRNLMFMAGNMQSFHGVGECIEAVSRVRERYPDVSLTLVGNVREDLSEHISGSGRNGFITSTGFLPYREMYERLSKGTAGLLVFQPTYYNISIGLPNKLFDYMLLGLPVIASDLPEIQSVVDRADCGVLVDPGSVSDIADAITYLFDHPEEARRMGESGRRAVLETYNWSRMESYLLQTYQNLDGAASASK
ncbi:glycosyltransferase family 4 protein [Methanoculleus sp. UBA303]|jgi:glycosyltransferase involved in cell wall biosynthesis|uniref:glycosyltransferase family 4 protein n=1 Tax=Methanoculleus sp. UBA303 TaxID=1915497 RepID=UPI0025DA3A59|nr:glycosyltransferase family 4 protein [Methanoculleus sp. UBA303]MDD3932308.1 glycosyltransferase family 4 protein [Methanoculleus sp.]